MFDSAKHGALSLDGRAVTYPAITYAHHTLMLITLLASKRSTGHVASSALPIRLEDHMSFFFCSLTLDSQRRMLR